MMTLPNNLDLSSFESFEASLKAISKSELQGLQQYMNEVSEKSFQPDSNWLKLYHGTPQKIKEQILRGGFELGKGQRSGFMGSSHEVDNQGIFLTDSQDAAQFFGENRSDLRGEASVLTCFVNGSTILSAESAPRDIVNIGLKFINNYYGSKKTRLAIKDWWQCLDQSEFVQAIKNRGYTGVSFREDPELKLPGRTYMIFDPQSIKIRGKQEDGVLTVKDFYEYLVKTHGQTTVKAWVMKHCKFSCLLGDGSDRTRT